MSALAVAGRRSGRQQRDSSRPDKAQRNHSFDFEQVDPLGDLWKAVDTYTCRWHTESDEEWHASFTKPGDPMPGDPRMPLRPRPGKTAKRWYRKARRRAEARRRAARRQEAIDDMWLDFFEMVISFSGNVCLKGHES